jgi:hypothetical protein
MDKLPADAALELSLYLSRKALRQGNADLCQFMASHARTLAAASTEGEGQRLNLYDEACRVAGSPEPLAAHSFEEAPLSLPPEDRHLWQAVQAMNNLIWEEPTARAADEELKPTQAPDESSDQELEASVTQQLQAIEKLIAKVPR